MQHGVPSPGVVARYEVVWAIKSGASPNTVYWCFRGGGSHSQCLVRSPGVAVSSGWCECGPLLEVACCRYWLYACSQPNQQYEQCRGRIGGGGGRPLGGRRRRTGPPAPGASCCSSSPGGGGGSSSGGGGGTSPASSHEPAAGTSPSAPCHVPYGARDAPRAWRPLLLLALWNSLLQVRWSPCFTPPPPLRSHLSCSAVGASCRLGRFLESAGIRVCEERLWPCSMLSVGTAYRKTSGCR